MTTKNLNTKTRAAIKESAFLGFNSLGKAQLALEESTKELRAAQAVYERAQERLTNAEEAHAVATSALVAEVSTVRSNAKVVPLTLK